MYTCVNCYEAVGSVFLEMTRYELVVLLVLVPCISAKLLNEWDTAIYRDCDDLRVNGSYTTSGRYVIVLNEYKPLQVLCRFDLNGAYTAIMQQKYGRTNFRQSYARYVSGFGSMAAGDFWLGLDNIINLNSRGNYVLTMTLQDWNNDIKRVMYRKFWLNGPHDRYRLNIGGYVPTSDLPDDFSFNNLHEFATPDVPDIHECATKMMCGWWFGYCTYTLPTGKYYIGGKYTPPGSMYDGIFYKDWLGYGYSLKYIKMELSRM